MTKEIAHKRDWKQLVQMAKTFFLIGGFTFGGGHAMIELIREEVVRKYRWLTDEEFIDLFAVAQSLPGVFAVNIAIFIGYRLQGVLGAVVCAISCTFPSFAIILLIAIYATKFKDNPHIAAIFKGIRPCVVALIASPCITVWKTLGLGWKYVWIPIVSAVAIWYFGISPVLIILISGVAGWAYTMYIRKEVTK